MQNCRKFFVSGKVQGVFFRDSTRREARALGLNGHAINLDDGRVEVLACGDNRALAELESWLHEGSEAASVASVESEPFEGAAPDTFSTG